MIWIAVLFLSSIAGFGEDLSTTTIPPETLIKRYQMECIEETRVDLDTIVKIRSKNWLMHYNQFLLAKEWALCVLMKSGVMTKEGVYKIDVAMQRLPLKERYNVKTQIEACLTSKAMPASAIAYYFIRCFQRMNNNSKFSSHVSAF